MNCDICGEPLDGIHILDGCPRPPRTRDEIIEKAAQVVHVAIAHRWMTVCSALREDHDYPELLRDIARALDNAGLLARPLPTREEIANAIHGDQCPDDPDPDEYCSCGAGDYDRMGDIVLELLKGQDE